MTHLLIATTNRGKLAEYRALLADLPFTLLGLRDAGITTDIPETGATFVENARLKAEGYAALGNCLTLADDSGLEVDALDGRPGVYSARYGGDGVTPADQHALLLEELIGVPAERRTARFVCVIAIAEPGQPTKFAIGTLAGSIAFAPRGTNGFGYDPIFWLPSRDCTLAELPAAEKHMISHRALATREVHAVLAGRARLPVSDQSAPNASI